jgi:hypothetical protein
MANDFSKEEIVMYTNTLERFEDQLIVSKMIKKYDVDPVTAERTNDRIWVTQPYISIAEDGEDVTDLIKDTTQLSVPITLGYRKNVANKLKANEYRDQVQEGKIEKAAIQALSSAVNVSCLNVASLQGTIVVTSDSASSSASATKTGFDKIAECKSNFLEQGIPNMENYIMLSSRDYNGMASNLAARTVQDISKSAYERAFIQRVANFDCFELDYAVQCAANAATVTISGANQYFTPKSTSTATTGEQSNYDNRFQTLTVDTTVGVVAGDSFTIADVYAVHHITKQSTGQLKTFRVISVLSGTQMVIMPAIVSNGGSTDAEAAYQNVNSTPADGASLTFLNSVAKPMNPFFHSDAMYITPGTIPIPKDAGVKVMQETTENGYQLTFRKWTTGFNDNIYYRWDVKWGVTMVQPEMAGILMFSQT